MSYRAYGIPTIGTRIFPNRNYSADQIPDLTGKTAVITGGTSGLGLESATQMASKGAKVVILGSSETRGRQAVETIKRRTGVTVTWIELNLFSIKASQAAAHEVKSKVDKIDILLLNAGITGGSTVSLDGYEPIFAMNHLGHFAFTQPLLDTFTGPDVRVVVLSSLSHQQATHIDYAVLRKEPQKTSTAFGDLMANSVKSYNVSKLANLFFARALQRRVGPNVYVNSCHPGLIFTNIQSGNRADIDNSYGFLASTIAFLSNFVFKNLGLSVQDGALTQLYCCTSPDIARLNHKGEYFVPIAVNDSSTTAAKDEAEQERLWTWSERAIANAA